MSGVRHKNRGFTLLELIIVVGIIAALAAFTIVVLDPDELLSRSRDAARISDLRSLNRALDLYRTEGGSFFGTSTYIYVSLPDSSPTCSNSALPGLPSGYSFACRTSADHQKTDGSGWIPLNLAGQISGGSPIKSLPIDPSNSASANLFYAFASGNRNWELTAQLESRKFNKGGSDDKVSKDGGDDPNVYEVGTRLTLNPLASVGYWGFDEGSGTTAGDSSNYGNNGILINSPTWQTDASCKTGKCLGFNGVNQYVDLGAGKFDTLSNASVVMWFKYSGAFNNNFILFYHYKEGANRQPMFVSYPGGYGNKLVYEYFGIGPAALSVSSISAGTFYFAAITCGAGGSKLYLNGVLEYNEPGFTGCLGSTAPSIFNRISENFNGLIDEVRVYNRALSADEIKYYYNTSK